MADAPSRATARYVLGLLTLCYVVNYLDRYVLATARFFRELSAEEPVTALR